MSPREQRVLELLGEQLTHAEIAGRLFISVRTVESHVASLRRKLDLPDHRSLVRFAVAERSSAGPAAGLPVQLTSFVGREQELTALSAALQTARLLSAVGPGGVGKTRLAIRVAEATAARYPDGIRFVDLIPVPDSARLETAVAHACGAKPSSRLGPVEALVSTLGRQQVLLVLDNCEHLVNAVAVLAERLVTACPALTILVTSRTRLAVAFERVHRVDGLGVGADGDAVELFVDRAVAAGSAPPSVADRERISAVCQALDGLALAVELAAVRLPSLGLEGVERGLLDQADLLTGGTRVNPRQQSMRETLDWSVALLDESARVTLRRLSVLMAPFDVEVATSVATFPPLSIKQIHLAVERLADHSLIAAAPTSAGPLVYRLLEPVRQYGLARMTAADLPALTHHLRWCRKAVDRLLDQPEGVDRVAADVRAALGWAAAQARPDVEAPALARGFGLLMFRTGHLPEAQQRLEQAAGLAADFGQAAADFGQAAAVAKCRVLGEEALRLELAAVASAESGGDAQAAALALVRSAELHTRFSGMFARVDEAAGQRLMDRARSLAPADALVDAAITVTDANSKVFDPGATGRGITAVARAREVGDPWLESAALDAATMDLVRDGDVMAAHRLAGERVAGILSRQDDPAAGLEIKDALHNAVFCALGAGDLAAARTMAERQRDLPFLREQHDLADEELIAPAALSGDWATVLRTAAMFLADWTAAGRPPSPGRALGPAAVALTHGLRGNRDQRAAWLDILAEIRGVSREDPSHGSGYGEVFDAMVLLHQNRAEDALVLLSRDAGPGIFALVFRQWWVALRAEAAVLGRSDTAPGHLEQARIAALGNPIATAIVQRASALQNHDRNELVRVAERFRHAGSLFQQARTLVLAAGMPPTWRRAGSRPR